jgi:hypothetical protein
LKKGPALLQRGAFNMSEMNCLMTVTERFLAAAILLAVVCAPTLAQEIKRPPLQVPEAADTAAKFVPRGWRLEDETLKEADLNGDGRPDAAFVISHGGDANDSGVVKHVLILALRGSDGKLHRSVVNDAAVFDGDEGGVFGDPFQGLSVARGVVAIQHYGGSRDRWSFTHKYRYQNGQWELIGLEVGSTDTLDLEHYDDQEINLSTGLVNAKKKGRDGPDGEIIPTPEIGGSYYELQVSPVEKAPTINGKLAPGEWPGYTVRLNDKSSVYRGRQLWTGINDLSAQLHAVRVGEDLFLCAQVTDNNVTSEDTVRLVNKRGQIIRPRESKKGASGNGYVFEARYSLKEIARFLKTEDKYIVENLEMTLDPASVYADSQGFPLPVSVEIVDVDKAFVPARGVLSTRMAGSPFPGAIRIFRKGTLVLVSDIEQ